MPKVVVHEDRRRQLADAVLALAARHGVGSVTTRAVAEEAGWSIGVVHHYFDCRRDLLHAGLSRASELQHATYAAIMDDPDTSALEKLHALTDSVLPLDERRLAMTRVFLFFYADGTASESTRAQISELLSRWRALVGRTMTSAVSEGTLPADLDIATAALHLTALTDGLALEAVLDPAVMAAIGQTDSVRGIVGRIR